MSVKEKLVAALPTTLTSWVTILAAALLVLVAACIAALYGSKEDAIVQTLLLNAGLFLGIQNARSAAVVINESRESNKLQVAKVNKSKPEVNVSVEKADVTVEGSGDSNSGM